MASLVATSDATLASLDHVPSPFHLGEQKVQTLTGAREISEQLGRAWHRSTLSPAATQFFADQQLLFTATRSRDEKLWASVLVGPRSFASSSKPSRLNVKPFRQFHGDPAEFNEGDLIGTLAIVLETRQRERLNGTIKSANGSLEIGIQQSFSGCPKYIQARKLEVDETQLQGVGNRGIVSEGGASLPSAQRQMVESSDTLFLATCYLGDVQAGNGERGADISHRGGPPGFARVHGAGVVRFADYVGNFTFTTLGNLVLDDRASLLFVDFSTGTTLQLSGTCQICWDDRELPGAERTIEFVTERWVQSENALPLRAPSEVKWSPYNPLPTCQYDSAVGEARLEQLHLNYVLGAPQATMLRCLSAVRESEDVMTFEIEHRGRRETTTSAGNLLCDPGQFATFDFPKVEKGRTLSRTWTISSPQSHIRANGSFTITVKKAGKVSAWLFENMRRSQMFCFRGVEGDFTLDRAQPKPSAGFLLIAGGIGITPMRTMFYECIEKDIPVMLLYSVRKRADAVFLEELCKAAEAAANAQVFVTLTQQNEQELNGHAADKQENGATSTLRGRISAEQMEEVCADIRDRAIFQCGPLAMMSSVETELSKLDFPLKNLHQEGFYF